MAEVNRFILQNKNSLNVELQFFQNQDENHTTDSILCDLIVPVESELNGKVAAVIDHKINCNYTQMDECELHFAIDCSDNMNGSKPTIQRALLDVVNRLVSQSLKVKVSCFGRSVTTWNSQSGENFERWLTATMTDNFGPHPEIAKCLRQIYSDNNAESSCPRQLILLTNAAPMNYDDCIPVAANARATGSYHNRTFTIGVDTTVSQGLCMKIANASGGKALFCSTNADIADHLNSQIASAQLKSNLRLKSFQTTLLNARANGVGAATYANSGLGTRLDNITLFNGNGDVETGSVLTDQVTHVRTGFIFDKKPTTGFLSVKVDVQLEEIDSGTIVSTSEELSIPFTDEPNAVFYSYIHEALNRRIQLRRNDESLIQSIIDLSKTLRVLCELTCFCYVRRTGRRRVHDRDGSDAPDARRPRLEYQISFGFGMDDLHGDNDNLQLNPLDREGGGHVFGMGDRRQQPRVGPRPSGHIDTVGNLKTHVPINDFAELIRVRS
jgi:hypothetical protein